MDCAIFLSYSLYMFSLPSMLVILPFSGHAYLTSTKNYDKRDDFDFEIVNFPFLDGYVPRSISYRVYISQLIRFARACSHVADLNTRNELLT